MQSLSQWMLQAYIQIYRKKVSQPYAMHITHSTRQHPLYQHIILEKCRDLYYKKTPSNLMAKTFSRPKVRLWGLKQQSPLLIFLWLRLRQQLSICTVQGRCYGRDISMTHFPYGTLRVCSFRRIQKRIFDLRFARFCSRKEREIRNWICNLGNLSPKRVICTTASQKMTCFLMFDKLCDYTVQNLVVGSSNSDDGTYKTDKERSALKLKII